jgi:PAS domain S-box-containing protein
MIMFHGARIQALLIRLPVIAAAAFALYSMLLFAYSLQSWQRMKRDAHAFLVADSQRRAAALGDYVGDLRNEAAVHADIYEIKAFLANRDLGMSPRYGLDASLQAIEDRLQLHANNRPSSAGSRIVYFDLDGKILADSDPKRPIPVLQANAVGTGSMTVDADGVLLVATEPVMHKEAIGGWVVTETPAHLLYRNLSGPSNDPAYRELLVTPSGLAIAGDTAAGGGAGFLTRSQSSAIGRAQGGVLLSAADIEGLYLDPDLGSMLLVKSPVPGLQLSLVTIVGSERAYGHLASPATLAIAAVVPLLLLFGVLRLDRMRRDALRLQAEVEASERERHFAERRSAEMATEICRREVIEAALVERSEQLKAIFSLSPDGFVSFDQEKRVQYVSPALCGMTGIDPQQLHGLREPAFLSRLNRNCTFAMQMPSLEDLVSEPDSERRHFIEMAGPPRRLLELGLRVAKGQTVSQILWFRDVTRESEVDRMKSEFLSTAAHELRTPMASVLGFSELLLSRGAMSDEQGEFLEIIHRNAKLMATIIDELLDLARIEARRGTDFRIEEIDLAALLHKVVAGFSVPPGRGIPEINVEGRIAVVVGDPDKLAQAVLNVLTNAYKYSPKGTPIEITLVRQPANGSVQGRLGIRIRDYGIGMTAEQLGRVFERFYRADTSGKVPGTGLGMSIVKEIVELHGGRVGLESQPGKGTTVTIWLNSAPSGVGSEGAAVSAQVKETEATA